MDTPRRPDNPPPPQPKPPQPNPDAHKDWQSRHEQNMKRTEKTPDPQQRGADQRSSPHPPGAIDGGRQPGTRADQAGRPGDKGHPSFDLKRGQAERTIVHRPMDADQYRQDQKGPVNLERMRTDVAKQAANLGAEHKANGRHGAMVIDVRLKNAAVGKGSEAMAIQKTLEGAGRKDNVHVKVTVEGANGALYKTDGTRLTAPRPPVPTPDPGGGGPGRPAGPKPIGPPPAGKPGAPPQPPGQPGGPHPPQQPVSPHVRLPHLPPPDIHRR